MLFELLFTSVVIGIALAFDAATVYVVMAATIAVVVAMRSKISDSKFVQWFLNSLVYIFFRDIDTRNSHQIPAKGPLLFV